MSVNTGYIRIKIMNNLMITVISLNTVVFNIQDDYIILYIS